jgi:hypothetical protein
MIILYEKLRIIKYVWCIFEASLCLADVVDELGW